MYENRTGVLAVGKVLERWDGVANDSHFYYTALEHERIAKKWRERSYEYRIAVEWFQLSDPIDLRELEKHDIHPPRGTVKKILKDRAEVEELIKKRFAGNWELLPTAPAEESDIEGLKTEVRVLKTKRSRKLRYTAFEAANGICCVCDRDFSKILNGRGIRVLQVHHRDQLSAREVPSVTKQSDLAVVCANCHLLLHLDSEKALSVNELREMLRADEPCN